MSITESFIAEIEKWIGTPYVTKGCTLGKRGGTTCGHYFLDCMIRILPRGVELLNFADFSHKDVVVSHLDLVTPAFKNVAAEIPLEEMQRGDIPILEFFHTPVQPIVFLGGDQFIYCSKMGVLKGPLPSNLRKRITRVYRWKEE